MVDDVPRLEPILIYPSRQSVIDLFMATLERNSNADLPDGWPNNEPLYLQENDAVSSVIFQEVLDDVISGAEPAPWLLRDLKEFEQMLVEYLIEALENTQEGQSFLNARRSAAVSRARAQSNQEQHPHDAQ